MHNKKYSKSNRQKNKISDNSVDLNWAPLHDTTLASVPAFTRVSKSVTSLRASYLSTTLSVVC